MDEFDIIKKYFLPLSSKESLNFEDDAALLGDYVISTDALICDVHFFKGEDPYLIAKKALRVNISDMAAMGAEPKFYNLALVLPKNVDENYIAEFARGLKEDGEEFGVKLIGGDTVVSTIDDFLSVTITIFGEYGKRKFGSPTKRNGAKTGDLIFVTGAIGDAAIGLKILQGELQLENKEYFVNRYHLPNPRIDISRQISEMVNSAIDISDGLIVDLIHILKASKKSAKISKAKIPVKNPEFLELSISGGDDYELLFTAPEKYRDKILAIGDVTEIGKIIEGEGEVLDEFNKKIDNKGFNHFSIA